MRDANEDNAEKYDIDLENALAWSKENKEIYNLIMRVGYDRESTINRHYLKNFYSEIYFKNCEISKIDKNFKNFENLKHLDLTYNLLKSIENLPINLTELIISHNSLETISQGCFLPNLLYLKLSHNNLKSPQFKNFKTLFPKLMSLDASFNNITNINAMSENLLHLQKLKMLCLKGNPIELLRFYKDFFISELQNLEYFDLEKISKDDEDEKFYVVKNYTELMKMQYGENYEEKVLEMKNENQKMAKKGGKKKDKKGAKKRPISSKKKNVPEKNSSVREKTGEMTTEQDVGSSHLSNKFGNGMSKSINFLDKFQLKKDEFDLMVKIRIESFEGIKPAYFEEIAEFDEDGEIKGDIDAVMSSYWFEYEFSNFYFFEKMNFF